MRIVPLILHRHVIRAGSVIVAVLLPLLFLPSVWGEESPSTQAVAKAEKPLCGAHCLYVALRSLDVQVEGLDALQARLGTPPAGGYSFAQLADVAQQYGVQTLGVETTLDNLSYRSQRFACIAHWQPAHFVNIADVGEVEVVYFDAPGVFTMPRLSFSKLWDGRALLLAKEPLLPEESLTAPPTNSWTRWIVFMALSAAGVAAAMFWRSRRSRLTILVVTVPSFVCGCAPSTTPAVDAGTSAMTVSVVSPPVLQIDDTQIDLGIVPVQSTQTAQFTLRNVGALRRPAFRTASGDRAAHDSRQPVCSLERSSAVKEVVPWSLTNADRFAAG